MKQPLTTPFILAIVLFAIHLSNGEIKGQSKQSPGFQGTTLTIPVSVISREMKIVEGLKAENFRVLIDEKTAQIVSVVENRGPASVGFLIDVSRLMNASYINEARKAIITIIESSDPRNEYFLKAFHTGVDTLSTFGDGKSISKILSSDPYFSTDRPGKPALFDAVITSLDEFSNAKHDRHFLIVFGDARDRSPIASSNKLWSVVTRSSAIIHFFGRSGGEPAGSHSEFSKLARASGGLATNPFNDSHETMSGARPTAPQSRIRYIGKDMMYAEFWSAFFADFASQLASSYMVTFKPLDPSKNNENNKLVVTVELTPQLKSKYKEAFVRRKNPFIAGGK